MRNKIAIKIIKNYKMCKLYGFAPILSNHIEGLAYSIRGKNSRFVSWRHQYITKKLEAIDSRLVLKNSYDYKGNTIKADAPIWFFWWDGPTKYPEIVKLALSSIKQHANSHKVIELSSENLEEYLVLPDDIRDKFQNGKISVTHYSDIIRFALLAKYGGIWMDSTIYMVQPLPDDIYKLPLYTIKRKQGATHYISDGQWTTYFWCVGERNSFAQYCYDYLIEYWRSYSKLLDYTFLDYIIYIANKRHANFHDQFDQIPYNNENCKLLLPKLRKAFSADEFRRLCEKTSLFKLSWKEPYFETDNGKKTYFAYLKEQCSEYSNY